jgi:hypothetical protein
MPRRHHTLTCAKTGSCALGPFSVGYTMSISGRQRALAEFLRTTGRPDRDLSRQNSFHPARCQRIIVSGRTTTKASRQSKNRENNARRTHLTGSMRRGLAPRSTYWASCRRRNKISASRDRRGRIARPTQEIRSAANRTMRDTDHAILTPKGGLTGRRRHFCGPQASQASCKPSIRLCSQSSCSNPP